MPIKLTKNELLQVVSGTSVPGDEDLAFEGLHFDSRLLSRGELFVCLPGAEVHGHKFLDKAFNSGAALALVEESGLLANSPHASKLVCVDDSLAAFSRLATWWREKLNVAVLAITGSVGKTTTKSLAAAILSKHSPGTASVKSFNNHIGVPFTLCSMSPGDKWAVLEMGMNHAHELSALSRIARPDVVIITCIAPVHLEFFSSLRDLAEAKFEILEGVRPGGVVVLNGEDPELRKQHRLWLRKKQDAKTVWFGKDEDSELAVSNEKDLGFEGIGFNLRIGSEQLPVRMKILGLHNTVNVAAAALGAKALVPEITPGEIGSALSEFKSPASRLNLIKIPSGRVIVDDAYNASPISMQAALELVAELQRQGKKVGLLLGSMNELGDRAEQYHIQIGEQIRKMQPQFVITVGELAAFYGSDLSGTSTTWVDAKDPESAAVAAAAQNFDILLVKASRAVGLDRSILKLQALLANESPRTEDKK